MKRNTCLLIMTATICWAVLPVGARAQIYASPEACVVDDNSSGSWTNWDEAIGGYLRVKAGTPGALSSGKSYFQFTIPSSANTNGPLTLNYNQAQFSSMDTIQIWALDQAYPTMDANLTWDTAQANDTSNTWALLTDGPYTATLVQTYQVTADMAGLGKPITETVPGPWGQYVHDGTLTLVLTEIRPDPIYGSAGHRVATGTCNITADTLTTGSPPSVGPISNLMAIATQFSGTNTFTVGDPEDGPTNLVLTATSSDTNIVADADVYFAGSGTNRTVYVKAGVGIGTATITVTATDSDANRGQRAFTVTVGALNYSPVITCATPVGTLTNTPVTVSFTVGDAETAATNLTVFAEAVGYASSVISTTFTYDSDTSGSNRTVTVTPLPDTSGVGVIKLSVVDENSQTSSVYAAVEVLAPANAVLLDDFSYSYFDNLCASNVSGGLWTSRETSSQTYQFVEGQDAPSGGYAWVRGLSSSDGGVGRLLGRPYSKGAGWILYRVVHALWLSGLPSSVGVYSTTANALLHFSDGYDGNGSQRGIVACFSNATTSAISLRIGNGALNVTPTNVLNFDTWYKIVTRYDCDTAKTTVWVDPTSEADPGTTAADNVSNPGNIVTTQIRIRSGQGSIYLDDISVLAVKKPKITGVQPGGGNVTLLFSAQATDVPSGFIIQRASPLTAGFNDTAATITSLGAGMFQAVVPASGAEGYFRVKRPPLTF